MRKHAVTNVVRVLLLSWSLTICWCSTSNAAEQQNYQILFLGGRANIEFRHEETQEGDGIGAYIAGVAATRSVFVDLYEPEGGVTPEIKSVFVNGRNPKKLFVIVAWAADSPSVGTGGAFIRCLPMTNASRKKCHCRNYGRTPN
jgi:hypothetical protein